ncbi:MAG TPA: diaminopimelate decarboxylase [Candidatus Acidoferrum sp.]|nr:diaminopimelate decarboxylase [Candidatus Acidoferrum sp.]
MSAVAGSSSRRSTFIDPAQFTPHFAWKRTGRAGSAGEEVFCERVALSTVAEKVGTPTYLYSREAIEDAYRELDRGLGALPHTLCFAVKSNGNLSILKYLAQLGSGFDIVSGGELEHLRRIGVRGDRIVFSGVGKDRYEIRQALNYRGKTGGRAGILLFNVESEAELEILVEESARIVKRGGARPAVAIRVNPDVLAGGHPHIATGRHEHKFGMDWAEARRLYLAHRDSKWIRWEGVSAHIGSQITSLEPFRRAVGRLCGFVEELQRAGIKLHYLDVGGGLGVRYAEQEAPSRTKYARLVAQLVRKLGVHLLLEPGRSIIAPAGILLTRVVYTKTNRGKTFVVVDSAMNDLMRPALYGAVHPISKVSRDGRERVNALRQRVDIVGPVCETGDCFLRDWPLGDVKAGDLLAIWVAGAYGMSQASNYNARCRPAEVLVEGKRYRLIRRRETQSDLWRTDVLA